MEKLGSNQLLKQNAIWLVFIIEIIIFAIASHGTFVTGENLINIARQVSYYGIASIGMTFVILIAGIDLSIGSIITLVNVVCAFLMVNAGMNMWPAVLITLLMATAIGVINGGMVATIGIPALIATFASQTVFQGIAYLISGGRPIAGFSSDFGIFARWSIGPVPICALIMVFCFALGSFILNKTYFGRYFYAIGGNEEAAALSGIRVNRVKYLIYALSGLFAGLAGIVLLQQSGYNDIYRMKPRDAALKLFLQFLILGETGTEFQAVGEIESFLLRNIPIWCLENTGDEASAVLTYQTLLQCGEIDNETI